MKTTLVLPDPLHRRAKARAAELGLSLTAFVRRAIEAAISPPAEKARRPFRIEDLPTHPLDLKVDVSTRAYLDLLD